LHVSPPALSRGFSTVPTDEGGDAGEAPKDEEENEVIAATASTTAGTAAPSSAANDTELKKNLKPSEIVDSLNRHIVGQHDAKRAVAIAMRNRWRRRQLSDELRKEVTPRNVLLVGPTGCVQFVCDFHGVLYDFFTDILRPVAILRQLWKDRSCSAHGHDQ
jgi:hypothetical protein